MGHNYLSMHLRWIMWGKEAHCLEPDYNNPLSEWIPNSSIWPKGTWSSEINPKELVKDLRYKNEIKSYVF